MDIYKILLNYISNKCHTNNAIIEYFLEITFIPRSLQDAADSKVFRECAVFRCCPKPR